MAPKTNPPAHSADARAEALRLHAEIGPAKASEQTGIPSSTIRAWASKARQTSPAAEQTAAAMEAARRSWGQRRAELTDETGLAAQEILGRLRNSKKPLDTQRLAHTLSVLIEKLELLDGRATERVELSEADLRDHVKGLRDEMAERRKAKAAG